MAWDWWSPYPGRGPWRHLPPPLRPGWVFRGRGWCWWLYYYPSLPPWLSTEYELRYLEDLKKYLSDVVLREIDRRIEELKKSKSSS